MGIESDTATGWPATDWFETLVAKYGGVDEYNKWITNEVKFDSDLVQPGRRRVRGSLDVHRRQRPRWP